MTPTPNDMPGARRRPVSDMAVARAIVDVLGDLHFDSRGSMGVKGQDVLTELVSRELGVRIPQYRIGKVMSDKVNEIADIVYPGHRVLIDRETGVYNLKSAITEPGELVTVLARMRKTITAGARAATECGATENQQALKSVARIWDSTMDTLSATVVLAEDQLSSLTRSKDWRAMAWSQ